MTFTSWTATLQFVSSEVWRTVVLSLLFLQLFNEICHEKQFKRFVPVVYCISNIGLLCSAFTSYLINYLITTHLEYNQKKYLYTSLFVFLTFCTIILFLMENYLINKILSLKIFRSTSEREKKPSKEKIGFVCLKLIFSTNVIIALCVMVLGYNIIVIMNESSYKSCLHEAAKEFKKDTECNVLINKFIE